MIETGKVLKSTGTWYTVELADGRLINCRIRGKMKLLKTRATNPIAVGDMVSVSISEKNVRDNVIQEVHPRENYIARRATNLSKQKHILAANIDRAYLLITLHSPTTQLAFIDRFLVAAESFRIPTTILINKIDMLSMNDLKYADTLAYLYRKIGYPCHTISAKDENTIHFLFSEIKDKQVLISGHSGVGKSTLINALDPSLNIKTNEISQAHLQGQHTTTFAEMHKLPTGGYIIDTPGIRGFGVVDLEKEHIAHYFPEMRRLLGTCRFHNCKHLHEPQCAVRKAVKNRYISDSRYLSYVQLMEEDSEDTYRRNIHAI